MLIWYEDELLEAEELELVTWLRWILSHEKIGPFSSLK